MIWFVSALDLDTNDYGVFEFPAQENALGFIKQYFTESDGSDKIVLKIWHKGVQNYYDKSE